MWALGVLPDLCGPVLLVEVIDATTMVLVRPPVDEKVLTTRF